MLPMASDCPSSKMVSYMYISEELAFIAILWQTISRSLLYLRQFLFLPVVAVDNVPTVEGNVFSIDCIRPIRVSGAGVILAGVVDVDVLQKDVLRVLDRHRP